jgi:hypothetical protein
MLGEVGSLAGMERDRRKNAEHAAERAIGNVLTLVLLVAVIVQLVRGEDASPYAQLLLLAGAVWGVTLAFAFWRGAPS